MLINVKDIPITGKFYEGNIREKDLEMDVKFLTPVHFEGTAYKTGEDIRLCGHVATSIEVNCHRCLEPFSLPIDSSFELYYRPLPTRMPESIENLPVGELGVMYYEDSTIQVASAVRDTIIIETPMKLVCREDCAGLCSQCGANLNLCKCLCQNKQESYNPFKAFFEKRV